MQEYSLPRSGFPPVAFQGERIAEAVPPPPSGRGQWHELRLFRSAGGKLILHIAYRSTWHPRQRPNLKEPDHDTVLIFEQAHDLPTLLQEHTAQIRSYAKVHPRAPQRLPDKQQKLWEMIEFHYRDLANQLVTAAAPALGLAERID